MSCLLTQSFPPEVVILSIRGVLKNSGAPDSVFPFHVSNFKVQIKKSIKMETRMCYYFGFIFYYRLLLMRSLFKSWECKGIYASITLAEEHSV